MSLGVPERERDGPRFAYCTRMDVNKLLYQHQCLYASVEIS